MNGNNETNYKKHFTKPNIPIKSEYNYLKKFNINIK